MLGHQVPFVNDEDTGLVVLFDVADELSVDFRNPLPRVKKHQRHIGVSNTPLRAMGSIKVDVGSNAFASSQTGCVDGDHRFAVHGETNVDAVTGCPSDFAHDHTIRFGDRVDKRALADVTPSDDSELHFRFFQWTLVQFSLAG